MRSSLRSQDSGNHTCMASDSLGNQGMATIQITVVTVGKYNMRLAYFFESNVMT